MSFLLFVALAFAGEPSTSVADAEVAISAAKEARAATITAYRAKLDAKRTEAEAKLKKGTEGCAAAKTIWTSMQEPIAATNTELKLVPLSDVSPEIAAANATYRKELEKLKAGYDAKIAQALKDAKANSTVITAAKADIAAVDAEFRRLDEQAEKEERMANTFDDYEGIGGLIGAKPGNNLGEGLAWESNPLAARRSVQRRPVYLPIEFTVCFPSEVQPAPTN